MLNTLKPISERLDVSAMLLGIALLSAFCLARNAVWYDDFTLWKDSAAKGPYNSRAHSELGRGYEQRGFIAEAMKEWEQALRINPYYAPSRSALGIVYL